MFRRLDFVTVEVALTIIWRKIEQIPGIRRPIRQNNYKNPNKNTATKGRTSRNALKLLNKPIRARCHRYVARRDYLCYVRPDFIASVCIEAIQPLTPNHLVET